MTISFIGHSFVYSKGLVKNAVKDKIREIFNGEKLICYIGGYGDFDEICANACHELRMDGVELEIVLVIPYNDISARSKTNDALKSGLYDSSLYPPIEKVPLKYAILQRNKWMLSNADVIIAYIKHNFGGAYQSLQAAGCGRDKVINVCDHI